jgi:DNA polymerase I-like protein with 3'-5' exonuclease and polymerase domains
MDIYKQLAGDVLGKPADEVTAEERGRAKAAFWVAFGDIAKLAGNEHLTGATAQ